MASQPTSPPASSDPRRTPPRVSDGTDSVPSQQDISRRLYPRGNEVTVRHSDPLAPNESQHSLIDHSTAVNGKLRTEGDLHIEGLLEGELECQGRLFVAAGARVVARVSARTVIVAGEVEGDIVCQERFEALPSARVAGSVRTPQLTVHEGAKMDGSITMSSGDETVTVQTNALPSANGSAPTP